MPARSLGSRSSCIRRSAATSSVTSWRRWSPESRASASSCSMPMRSSASDLLELLGHLAVGTAQVTPVELLLPLEAQLVEQVAQPLDLLAVGGPPPPVEHALQRLVQVAVGQQVVGQLREDGVGVVDERVLGAVPPPVVEPPGHPRPR